MKIAIFLVFAPLLLTLNVFAAQINSQSYKQSVIVSTGGDNLSSQSYKNTLAVGIINSVITSASYINSIGFFHTLLLANDQPCTSANQCEGGFCCSSSCASSSCPTEAAVAGGGGGGGGGAAAGGGGGGEEVKKVKDFSVSPSSIKEQLTLGATKTKTITIKNTGDVVLDFSLNVLTVNEFVSLSESSFSIEPGEEMAVEANIIGRKLGSYIGEIQVTGDGVTKSIDAIIEVESEQVLFDVKIDIPSGYKEVEAGSNLKAQITLLNVGPARKVDVTPTYIIKDRLGKSIYEASETFAVEKQTSFVKVFNIPKDTQPGDYLAIVEVRYENSFAVSSELFKVVPKEKTAIQKILVSKMTLTSAFVVFSGLLFLFLYSLIPKMKIFKKK